MHEVSCTHALSVFSQRTWHQQCVDASMLQQNKSPKVQHQYVQPNLFPSFLCTLSLRDTNMLRRHASILHHLGTKMLYIAPMMPRFLRTSEAPSPMTVFVASRLMRPPRMPVLRYCRSVTRMMHINSSFEYEGRSRPVQYVLFAAESLKAATCTSRATVALHIFDLTEAVFSTVFCA